MPTDLFSRLKTALAGRYDIVREIGAGGMATVYLAEDAKHHRKVAVKVLRPELAATLGGDRFFREIEIAAQLQHPHILPLLDSGEAEGFLYFVMPFVDGESLRDRLARQGELPISEAVRILKEVVDALAHAHRRGVVHRDIKPDNVMLSERHALVTDFGVAKAVSEATGRAKMTTAGVALGTPAYMSPEQAAADPHVDHRADIYAVGAMGYELLAGRPPFTGLTPQQVLAAHVTEAPEPVTKYRATISPALSQVVMKCLAKRPADRWQSADELLAALEPLATPSGGTTPVLTAPFAATDATAGQWYGHPLRVAGLFLLASVAVLGVVYFLTIQLGLPDWVMPGAAGLLAVGLPIMIVTGLIERRRAIARTTGAMPGAAESGLHGWVTWRKAILGGGLAFGALTLGIVVYTLMRLLGIGPVGTLVAAGKLNARDRLIVADFDNRTADSTLGPSVTEAFRIDLAQSSVVSLMPASSVHDALGRMQRDPRQPLDAQVAREVAAREGAKAVVVGEISPLGRGYVLSARLMAPDGAELVALRETADDDGAIIDAVDRLSGKLRERIGESLRSIRGNEPLDQVTTASLEALRLYSEGARASDFSQSGRAIELLEQAIALDTGFAMAYRKLAVALSNAGAEYSRTYSAMTKAYQHRDRLTQVERGLTTAGYYSYVEWNQDKTIAAYRDVLSVDPDNAIALNNLSGVLTQRREWREAEQLAARTAPTDITASPWFALAAAQMAQGKVAETKETLTRFAQLSPDTPSVKFGLAVFAASQGSYDTATALFHEAYEQQTDPSQKSQATFNLFAVEEIQGKMASGARYLREDMALSEKRRLPSNYVNAAVALGLQDVMLRRDSDAGILIVEEALRRHPLDSMAVFDRPYATLAYFYASAGQPGRAKQLLSENDRRLPEGVRRGDLFLHMANGAVAMSEGRPTEAIAEYQAFYDETGCTNCALYHLGRAYEAANQPDSALAVYERAVTENGLFRMFGQVNTLGPTLKRLGEMYEDRGDRTKAVDYYGRFVHLWKDADAELQPQVKEVKERMAKLVGEKQ